MSSRIHRRKFVAGSIGLGALASVGDFSFLGSLPRVTGQQVNAAGDWVRLAADIDPLVRLLEETPRARVLEEVAGKIRRGASYQELLAATMLAGVRGIQPRPVGFKFHAVLVVNSAHLAAMSAADRDRWLPLFWAIDNFKVSQERNGREGNWHMRPIDDGQLPATAQARDRFIQAMDRWDEEGADRAIVSLVRSAGAADISELFWRYGARDFRSIGHKAIFAANAWRTLQTIGWRHAEPIMRSLAYALLAHDAAGNPAERNEPADIPWRENQTRAARIRAAWQTGRVSEEATRDFLAALRSGTAAEGSEQVVTLLNRDISPNAIWDGLFLMAGECLMRQPGIVGLHCVTTVNALYYAYQTSGNDETRRLMMLQAAAFLPMFREAMRARGNVRDDVRIDTLDPIEVRGTGNEAVEDIFSEVSRNRQVAAQKTISYLQNNGDPEALLAAARRLVFTKGTDSHDYKFSEAILEDFYHATPALRNRFLATGMFYLKGTGSRDTDLLQRTRAALA